MPLFTADDLRDNAPLPIPSLVGDGLLPARGTLLITGRTETGKSVIGFDIAFSLVLGEPLFRAKRSTGSPYFPVKRPCKVLYLDSELGPAGCHERLQMFYEQLAKGIDLGQYLKIISGDFKPLLLHRTDEDPQPFNNLERLIAEERPDVLIVDPFGDYQIVEENSSEIRHVFRYIRALQNAYGFASIILHHESDKDQVDNRGKLIHKDGTGRSRGHSAITQSVDTMLALRREKKNPYTFMEVKWAKTRHQGRPPTGCLFIDFTRMHIEWIGTQKAVHPALKKQVLEAYKSKYPLDEEVYGEDL